MLRLDHEMNTDPTTWVDVACEVVGRNLIQQEWEQFVPGDEPYAKTCDQYPPGN